MNEEYTFKNLSDVETVENPSDSATVVGFNNGEAAQFPIGSIGGGVFVIDPDASDFSMNDTAYGDKVKDALLAGKQVLVYKKATYDYDVYYYCLVRSFCLTYRTTTSDSIRLRIYFEDSHLTDFLSFAITT